MKSIILTPEELVQVASGVIVTPGDRKSIYDSAGYEDFWYPPERWTALKQRSELRRPTPGWGHDAVGHGPDPGVLVARCSIDRIEPADNGQFAIHLTDLEFL